MASIESEIVNAGGSLDIENLEEHSIRRWKGYGFSDAHIADAMNGFEPHLDFSEVSKMTRHRHSLGIHPVFRMVDSCAAEFAAVTPYYYSTYEGGNVSEGVDRVQAESSKKLDEWSLLGPGQSG